MEYRPHARERLHAIDILRGFVMLLMALDHTRDLFHTQALDHDPTDLATTTPALFLTRWITHLCAPVFVFLSGASAYLAIGHQTVGTGRRHLLTRGIWLVVLEFTVINFGIWADPGFSIFLLQVIAAIGLGFIVLGLLRPLPPRYTGGAGLVLMLLLTFYPFSDTPGSFSYFLRNPGLVPLTENTRLVIAYPPLPWIAIMLAGFGAGMFFERRKPQRKYLFFVCGTVCLLLFALLRIFNSFGDPAPWAAQKNLVFTFFSFFNVSKYPPSLSYTLLMLGLMFFLLRGAESRFGSLFDWMRVYGKVPLFFYLVHWYVLHSLLFILIFASGYDSGDLLFGPRFGRPATFRGLSLPAVYLVWVCLLAAFYPLCRLYGDFKSRRRDVPWLKYL